MLENILIADDSATARMIIRRCFEIAGCVQANFIEAKDGEEALELAKKNELSLMVTDINMPNMDGRVLLKNVKASPKLTEIPVIVISSASNDTLDKELVQQGAFAVVKKPVSPASISGFVQELNGQNPWG